MTHLHILNENIKGILQELAPQAAGKKRPTWLAASTVELIQAKAYAFRKICRLRFLHNKIYMEVIFKAWKGQGYGQQWAERKFAKAVDYCYIAEVKALENKKQCKQVRAAVKADKKTYIDGIIDGCAENMTVGKLREVSKAIDRLKPRRGCPVQAVRREDGVVARNPEECRRMWAEHWTQRFKGDITTFTEVVEEHMHRCVNAAEVDNGNFVKIPTTAASFCTVDKIATAMSKVNTNKTHGEDCIPAMAFKKAPSTLAHLFYPVMLKAWLTGLEPPQWAGGVSCEILKGAGGDHFDMNAHRAVVVSDISGKLYHGFMRSLIVKPLLEYLPGTSFGGLPGRSTIMAHQMAKMTQRWARKKGKALAVLYTDAIAAFDMVRRALVCNEEDSTAAAREAKIPLDVVRSLAAAHALTWTTVQGLAEVIRVNRGSRAGDPLADAVFLLLLGRIMSRIDTALDMLGIEMNIPWKPDSHILAAKTDINFTNAGATTVANRHVGFVDDVAFHVAAEDTKTVMKNLEVVAKVVAHVFYDHDLRLNWKRDKTEAMLWPGGRDAKQIRESLAVQEQPTVPVDTPQGIVQLRLVQQYIHLGSVAAVRSPIGPEITRRRMAAKSAQKRITPLLKNKGTSLERKMHLTNTYYMTKLLHGAEVWDKMNKHHNKAVSTDYMTMMRMAIGKHYSQTGKGISDKDMFGHGVMPVPYHIKKKRMMYLHKLMQAPECVRAAVQATAHLKGEWAETIRGDLAWMKQNSELFDDMPDPNQDIRKWEDAAAKKSWPTKVKAFFETLPVKLALAEGHRGGAGVDVELTTPVICCGKTLRTPSAVLTHNIMKHNHRNAYKAYAFNDATCRGCMMNYHTRPRLLVHLDGTNCVSLMQKAGIPPLSAEQIEADDEVDRAAKRLLRQRGRHATFADRPPVRVEGPPPRCAVFEW
eukprot:TRINITY_DN35330_c1_g2_i1.p1 TRINITY_DN35330_c1_g2~~TRINITY_DN35330_c1_g2_i1.p1  ORF type:complete len:985 (+),score=178.25 TRINITY_DN35330_c1_g2_i1:183-2957(+)